MRTKSSIKNLITAMLGQAVGLVVSFVARIVFIKCLNSEYLGVNGLFTNILTLLSLVELGVGPAMSYGLYKPISCNDKEKIKTLMHFYGVVYKAIGVLILVLGFASLPIYPLFVNSQVNVSHLSIIYLLFVFNTAASYFYSYKRTLIICDQKKYITTIYRYVCFSIMNIVQIVVLLLTKNYILFLLVQLLFTIIENILVSKRADRMYPYLKEKDIKKMSKTERKEIGKNVYAMSLHKVGSTVVNSTDNILISRMVGITEVGLYSNYYLVISALETITAQFFNAIIASVGNLNATEKVEKIERIFNKIFLLNYIIFGICSVCFYCLINPLITVWLGKDLTFSNAIVSAITACLFLKGMRRTVLTFRDAMGLFKKDRYKAIVEAVLNLAISIILGMKYGVFGVVMGTLISMAVISAWIEPFILYKYGFKMSCKKYFLKFAQYTMITFLVCLITNTITSYIEVNNILSLAIKTLVSLIISSLLIVLPFIQTTDFKELLSLLKKKSKK